MWVVWMVAARETRVLGRGLRKRPGGLLGVCWGGARRERGEERGARDEARETRGGVLVMTNSTSAQRGYRNLVLN